MSQLVTFTVAGHRFGIPVGLVQEVIQAPQMIPVPLAPGGVAGLVNLRGQVVTAIDLQHRLGLPAVASGSAAMNVVVRTPDGPVSLLVDRIGQVVELDDDRLEPVPSTLDEGTRRLVGGAYQLDDALLLALDVNLAIDVFSAAVPAASPAKPSAGKEARP
jgi:purine-binding chemotaxis protein CheW